MTKTILMTLFTVFFLTIAACKYQTMSAANTLPLNLSQEQSANKIIASPSNSISGDVAEKKLPALEKPFFVILGSINAEGEKVQLEGGFWGHDANEEEAEFYPDDKVEIDIMNCAGYIASAVTTYKGVVREVKITTETIAKDAVEKIKQCSLSPNSEIIGSDVFGIAPADSKRRNIKINKIDTKKLYNSLVRDIAAIKKIKKPKEETTPELKGTKGSLSLKEDNWTDLDGDGQIDLIEFYDAPCGEKDTCTWIFRLIDGKWKDIEYVFPL